MLTRRFFLKSSGLALIATGNAPSFLRRAVAMTADRKKILVALFQRGAVDGLNVVVPCTDDRYYQARPTLALARPGKGDEAVLDLDDQFGLHPALAPLKPFWDDNSFAIIHAAGSPDATRSHFDAQDYMETATPGNKGTPDGWLNRHLAASGRQKPSPLRAVSVGPQLPRALQGPAAAVAMNRIRDFQLARNRPLVKDAFLNMYGGLGHEAKVQQVLQSTSQDTFAALELLESIATKGYQPANGANYSGGGRFGQAMKQIAQLIKADVGLEVAFADSGGWDTHANQSFQLNNLLRNFGAALAAFITDLGSRMQDVVILTMSEFGRTVRENGNRGTDHGHANVMFVLGGNVRGGKIYGEWPGLETGQLFEGRDLALTTDFRDVFAEILARHHKADQLDGVFPGYSPKPKHFRGFLKA